MTKMEMEMTEREISLFEDSRKRFKEHLARTYPSLKQFKPLKAENIVASYIPLGYLNKLLWHYKLFDQICKKPSISKKYPKNQINEIRKILKELKIKNWLEDNDHSEIESLVREKLLNSPKGIKYKQEEAKLKVINISGGRWPDYALNFLIYFLVEYMKETQSKQNYSIIASFINKQTNHEQIDFTEIKKKYDRIRRNHNRLWMLFNTVHDAYFKDYFQELFLYKDFRPELNADFIKYCLPEFIDFYPPKKKQSLIGNQT